MITWDTKPHCVKHTNLNTSLFLINILFWLFCFYFFFFIKSFSFSCSGSDLSKRLRSLISGFTCCSITNQQVSSDDSDWPGRLITTASCICVCVYIHETLNLQQAEQASVNQKHFVEVWRLKGGKIKRRDLWQTHMTHRAVTLPAMSTEAAL